MLNKKIAASVCLSTLGLALSSTASFATGQEGVVTASALNVRSGPSTSYSVITKLYKGDKVEILESSNGWSKIKTSTGKTGWSSAEYLSTSQTSDSTSTTGKKATVTASTLNVRSGPSTSYSITTKVYKGETVEVLESSNGWSKIKTSSGKTGWASEEYLSTSGASDNTENSTTGKKVTVTASTLNVRSGPSTSYSITTKVYKGETVEVLESSNGWSKIKTSSGKTGWASEEYLSTSGASDNTENSTTGKKVTVTASTLNVRSGPSTSYSITTKVYKGETVEVLESSNGWSKIKTSSGKIGWASEEYLSTSGTSDNTENSTTPSDKVKAVVDLAYAQLGKPYIWGAAGPSSFDCSGLMTYIFKNGAGINLPRTSRDQSQVGTTISKSNLQPGDLIFSSTNGTGTVNHVGIYVGNGEMIHSPKPGDVVKKAKINTSYWNNAYLWAKRVI